MLTDSKRVALIAGGSHGMGFGIAEALVDSGFAVAMSDSPRAAEVAGMIAALSQHGISSRYFQGEISRATDRKAILDSVLGQFGRIDVFVNATCSEARLKADLLELIEEDLDITVNSTLKGSFFLTQLVANQMIGQLQTDPEFAGVIVNLSALGTVDEATNYPGDWLCRAGVSMTTLLWAHRLAEHGIAVFEVRAGAIRGEGSALVTDNYDQPIAAGTTINNRWGTPKDIGRAVATLARGELVFATGNVLNIDGGLTLRRL